MSALLNPLSGLRRIPLPVEDDDPYTRPRRVAVGGDQATDLMYRPGSPLDATRPRRVMPVDESATVADMPVRRIPPRPPETTIQPDEDRRRFEVNRIRSMNEAATPNFESEAPSRIPPPTGAMERVDPNSVEYIANSHRPAVRPGRKGFWGRLASIGEGALLGARYGAGGMIGGAIQGGVSPDRTELLRHRDVTMPQWEQEQAKRIGMAKEVEGERMRRLQMDNIGRDNEFRERELGLRERAALERVPSTPRVENINGIPHQYDFQTGRWTPAMTPSGPAQASPQRVPAPTIREGPDGYYQFNPATGRFEPVMTSEGQRLTPPQSPEKGLTPYQQYQIGQDQETRKRQEQSDIRAGKKAFDESKTKAIELDRKVTKLRGDIATALDDTTRAALQADLAQAEADARSAWALATQNAEIMGELGWEAGTDARGYPYVKPRSGSSAASNAYGFPEGVTGYKR